MIQEPAEASSQSAPARHNALVIQSQPVGNSFHKLRLQCAPIARQAQPGQFVHVLPHLVGEAGAYDPLLRRAFSVLSTSIAQETPAGVAAEAEGTGHEWFEILFRVGGRGTSRLARCREGDVLDVLGPLGNGFELERRAWSDGQLRPLLLVGGGIGVPPMVFAAQSLAHVPHETQGAAVEAIVGARKKSELVGVDDLLRAGAHVSVATDDGSEGRQGVVTMLLRERLEELARASAARSALVAPLVCACGPWPMLRAVALLCAELEVECRVSLEESMPCGIGVCNGCVVPVRGANDDYGRFRRICVQGPVLDAAVVDWGDNALSSQGPALPVPQSDDAHSPSHQGDSQ